jgi:stearoyl-CoA desaturase (delta-9 desaturase)
MLACWVGISVGYHRYWTHQSFKCPRWLQYPLAVCGAVATEGPLMVPPELRAGKRYAGWVPDHLQHHAYTDRDGDPHSPLEWGFWWAHMGWLNYETLPPAGWRASSRLDHDPVVRWQYRFYWRLAVGFGFVAPMLIGLWWAGWLAALQCLLIAGFLRGTLFLHFTWLVNSATHLWGSRARDAGGTPYTDDASRNNLTVALLTFGEGYHGNHHADPNSASLGVRWWDFDPGKWLIHSLRLLGLTWQVRPFAPRPPR